MKFPDSDSSVRPRVFIWQKLTGPVIVLLIEVAYLTTLVEFRDSRMAWIANPLLFSGGLIAATVFFLTTRESLESIRPTRSRSRLVVAMFFACLHADTAENRSFCGKGRPRSDRRSDQSAIRRQEERGDQIEPHSPEGQPTKHGRRAE